MWEENSADGTYYEFDVDMMNPSPADKYNPDYTNCYCNNSCSAGTRFEEKRCRDAEAALDENAINEDDWSFDPLNEIQGKQWK